jgi:hypothetical protein
MASYDEVKLEDILHGSFATFNPNTGANKDADSLPTLIVYEEGSSTALTVTSSVTNITTGRYRWQITIEASAGFEAGKYYEVWISATVTGTDTVTQVAPVTSFKATARVVDDVSTLTQTQVTGGAYALNSASFAFNSAMDFTTTQKAATLARVTLVDTTTTNTDMRGTDSALLASGYTTPPTTGAIADAVLTESILDHRNVAHSLAKFIWQIRQANLTIDGTVSNAITPTTLTFSSNVVATTSAYAHAVLLFTTGPLAGENSPIISYNSTNGVFLLEEPLTAAPSNGDEFVVIAGSHVHSVADISDSILTRNVSNVEATAAEHTLATAILGMLEWQISGNDLIIKRTDGTTTHYTKTLSSATGTGDVITGLN